MGGHGDAYCYRPLSRTGSTNLRGRLKNMRRHVPDRRSVARPFRAIKDEGRFLIQQVEVKRLFSFPLRWRVTFSRCHASLRNRRSTVTKSSLRLSTAAPWQAAPASEGGNACGGARQEWSMPQRSGGRAWCYLPIATTDNSALGIALINTSFRAATCVTNSPSNCHPANCHCSMPPGRTQKS